jgi:hypothetical protein
MIMVVVIYEVFELTEIPAEDFFFPIQAGLILHNFFLRDFTLT